MKSNSNKYKQIQQLISQKKFNESLICIENNKKDLAKLDYFFLKAVVHRYLNKYSEALILLSEVNKISPIYGRSYQEFGHNYVKLENKEMALKSYTRAVRYNPALQASWLGILGLGNADKNLIELADKNIIYLKNLPPELKSVLSFIHEGKLKKADDLCRFFLINSPHHIEAMKLLAIICKKLHVYDDSEFLLESCLEFDPENVDIKIEYIDTLLKRNILLINLMDKKFGIILNYKDTNEFEKVIYLDESDFFLGIECKKAIINSINKKTNRLTTSTIYYTNKIDNSYNMNFKKLKGFPIYYEIISDNIISTYLAVEMTPKKIDPKIFKIDNNTSIYKMEEFKTLMTQ